MDCAGYVCCFANNNYWLQSWVEFGYKKNSYLSCGCYLYCDWDLSAKTRLCKKYEGVCSKGKKDKQVYRYFNGDYGCFKPCEYTFTTDFCHCVAIFGDNLLHIMYGVCKDSGK